jgi:hypothetical protein
MITGQIEDAFKKQHWGSGCSGTGGERRKIAGLHDGPQSLANHGNEAQPDRTLVEQDQNGPAGGDRSYRHGKGEYH